MVGQELEKCRLDMLVETVQLKTGMIVYVDVFLLRNGKVLVIVKPFGIPDGLIKLQLAAQFARAPVHRRDMPFAPRQQQTSPVPRIIRTVWTQLLQLQLKPLLGRLDSDVLLDLILSDLVRPLQLPFGLEKTGFVVEEDLRIFRFQRGIAVLGLHSLQVPSELLVLDALCVYSFPSSVAFLRFDQSLLRFAGRDGVLRRCRRWAGDGLCRCCGSHLFPAVSLAQEMSPGPEKYQAVGRKEKKTERYVEISGGPSLEAFAGLALENSCQDFALACPPQELFSQISDRCAP